MKSELALEILGRALDDEPIFVLLGRDPHAPDLARKWAMNRRNEINEGKRPQSDMAQVNEAFAIATEMEDWREDANERWRDGLFSPHRINADRAETEHADKIENALDAVDEARYAQ